jgi:plastocyanin
MRHFSFLPLTAFVLLVGCGGDDATPNTTTDTGTAATDTGTTTTDTGTATTDTGTATTDTGTAGETGDSGPMLVNGCAEADYVDATTDAGKRKIDNWSTASGKICLKIKKGQGVTWTPTGGFSIHPLEPAGGDSGNPIMLTNTGTTKTVDFAAEGTFGYRCANHPTVMLGAIKVVP